MRKILIIWAMLAGVALCACKREASFTYDEVGAADTLTHHARYLTIADCGGGLVRVDIANPWDDDKMLARYALVDRDSVVPDTLPSDIVVIRTPVERAAVFSSVHTGAFEELGALGQVAAIADRQYFTPVDTVSILLGKGEIVDLGSISSPSVELMAASGVTAVLRSPMQGAAGAKYPSGVAAVECADYMEPTPIGRAEWILLLGELTGKRQVARDILDKVIDNYSSLVFKAGSATTPRPKILAETEYSGVWYVPQGGSYMARLYADAGADWPWADTTGSGSLSLSLEEVAAKALDADMWLVRSYGYETTTSTLKALNPRYTAFEAWKRGNIYSCDTEKRNIFNDVAFHPDKVLAEYIAIFHPELMPGYELQYFKHTR